MGHPVGRNDPCPCGSGKQFRRCCGASSEGEARFRGAPRGEPVLCWASEHAVWPRMRDALIAHAMEWLGIRLSVLQGQTPREAVGRPEGRALVEALLRDMEHRSHGTPMEEAYDFRNLRRELRLV